MYSHKYYIVVCILPVNQLYRVPLDMGGGVRSCDLADPYAVVLLVDGTVALLELCEEEATIKLRWPDIGHVSA